MRTLEFTNAHGFLEKTRAFLFNDEVAHNLILSGALALSKTHSKLSMPTALTFLAAVDDDNNVQGAALRTPQNRWIVSQTYNESALKKLAAEIDAKEKRLKSLRSLLAPLELQSHLIQSTREHFHRSHLNYMTASKLNSIAAASGLMRLALPKDLRLLTGWSRLSAVESHIDESPNEASAALQKYIDHRQLFVWEDSGCVVAMSAVGGFTPKTTRISQVYTTLKARGRGYGSTLVHRLTHRALTETGKKQCVLLADAANPTTKFIYEKLGFKTCATFTEFRRADLASVQPGSDPKLEASSH